MIRSKGWLVCGLLLSSLFLAACTGSLVQDDSLLGAGSTSVDVVASEPTASATVPSTPTATPNPSPTVTLEPTAQPSSTPEPTETPAPTITPEPTAIPEGTTRVNETTGRVEVFETGEWVELSFSQLVEQQGAVFEEKGSTTSQDGRLTIQFSNEALAESSLGHVHYDEAALNNVADYIFRAISNERNLENGEVVLRGDNGFVRLDLSEGNPITSMRVRIVSKDEYRQLKEQFAAADGYEHLISEPSGTSFVNSKGIVNLGESSVEIVSPTLFRSETTVNNISFIGVRAGPVKLHSVLQNATRSYFLGNADPIYISLGCNEGNDFCRDGANGLVDAVFVE